MDESLVGLGTQLRQLLDLMDGDVARALVDLGLTDYRPRFSPIMRALLVRGPSTIRDLADAISVTHSAASQTVAELARRGLVDLVPGADARQRVVRMTPKAEALVPAIEAEWTATSAAMAELDAELPFPLTDLVSAVAGALRRRPFRDRIAGAARASGSEAVAPFRDALARSATDPAEVRPEPPRRAEIGSEPPGPVADA